MFKYSEYKEFLKAVKSLGNTRNFRDWSDGNVFLIRHDIDFSVELAFRIAQVEKEVGVDATFFFLTTCRTYNVLAERNSQLIREIDQMGFEIGLHFDPTLYETEELSVLEEKVDMEAGILSEIIGKKVCSVSLHNPSVHGMYPLFNGYINAYDPKYFSDDCYISDSRMMFRGKNMYEFIKGIDQSSIQILTHPMHYSEDGSGYPEILYTELLNEIDILDQAFKVNSTYQSQVKEGLLHYIAKRFKD